MIPNKHNAMLGVFFLLLVLALVACSERNGLMISDASADKRDFIIILENNTENDIEVQRDPLFMPPAGGNKVIFFLLKNGARIKKCSYVDSFKPIELTEVKAGDSMLFEFSSVQVSTSHCIRSFSGISVGVEYLIEGDTYTFIHAIEPLATTVDTHPLP